MFLFLENLIEVVDKFNLQILTTFDGHPLKERFSRSIFIKKRNNVSHTSTSIVSLYHVDRFLSSKNNVIGVAKLFLSEINFTGNFDLAHTIYIYLYI